MIKITFILPDEFNQLASQDGYDIGAYIQMLLFNPLLEKYRERIQKDILLNKATQTQAKIDKASGELDAKIKYFHPVVCFSGTIETGDYKEKTFTLETSSTGTIIEAPPAGWTIKS